MLFDCVFAVSVVRILHELMALASFANGGKNEENSFNTFDVVCGKSYFRTS